MKRHVYPWSVAIALGLILAAVAVLALLVGPAAGGPAHAASSPCVPPPHSGTITSDQTWCLADGPQHLMSGSVTVAQGAVLTVEPGVTVQAGTANVALIVKGQLAAVGTGEAPIVFTSPWDSGPYEWAGIAFDGGTGLLRHAVVRNSGRGCYGCPGYYSAAVAAVNVQAGEVRIEDSEVIASSGGLNNNTGLYVGNSQAVVSNTLFTAIGDAADDDVLYLTGDSSLSLSGSAIEENPGTGLRVASGAAQVQIAGTSIVHNGGHGVWVSGDTATVTMSGSTVMANTLDGVRNNGNAQVVLGGAKGLGNTILGNGGKGANQVGTGTQMLATHNWWGDATGPYHPTLNPGGLGENVSDRVLFDPWAVDWQGQVPEGVYVTLVGPRQVVSGGQAAYVVMYVNGRDETIEDAVLVVILPSMAFFQDATHGGEYWAQRHAAVWKLGHLEPGASGTVAVQVQYAWGLPIGPQYAAQARLGGTNLKLGLADVHAYLDFSAQKLLGSTPLTDAELAAERAAYPDLDQIYTEAEAAGYLPGGAVRLALDTAEPITQVVFLRRAGQEVMYLRRQGAVVLSSTFGGASYAVRQAEGGLAHDLQANADSYWGTWGSGETPSERGLAYSDCRHDQLPANILDSKVAHLSQVLSSFTCYPCLSGGSCTQCFAALQGVNPLPEATAALACVGESHQSTSSSKCTPCDLDIYVKCPADYWGFGQLYQRVYDCALGCVVWDEKAARQSPCREGQSCVPGEGLTGELNVKIGCVCKETESAPFIASSGAADLSLGFRPFAPIEAVARPTVDTADLPSACSSGDEEGTSDCPPTDIRRPADPNAKYGLEGDLLAGQTVTYTVTYENVGDGRAYGVFVVDQLDPALDLSTLTIYGPGELIAENRTILWTVGELGPKGDPDSSGVVSFTVALRDDLLPGTAVINQATVFFPTVGEVTPTNAVVNVVQPLAAVPQRLETAYLQPVAITLAGRAPAGVPLSFQVLTEPLNGTLTGTAPELVYTPAENATGLDEFTFKVSGGGQESRPATVQIVIDPAGDATPPAVVWVYPADGATDVMVSARPVFTDEVGPVWGPLPYAQFSEAMDEESITDNVVLMLDGAGQAVPVSVAYSGVTRRATVYPRQALTGGGPTR